VKLVQTAIAGVVGVVAGGSILSPSFARREGNWHDKHREERTARRAGRRIAARWREPRVADAAALVCRARVPVARRALLGFVIAHLFLMRRHGISGALKPVERASKPFYPYHALKDTLAGAAVFAVLLTFALVFRAALDPIADPSDASYVPTPEWYFLSLFQLLKYFPGPLEPLATIVIPALVVGLLLLLPFLHRGPDRHVLKRPLVTLGFGVIGLFTSC
jgi:hypothetical protein